MSDLKSVICPEGLIAVPTGGAVHTVNVIVYPDGGNITLTRDGIAAGSTFADYIDGQKKKLQSGLPGFTEIASETPLQNPLFSNVVGLGFTHTGQSTKTWQYTLVATQVNNPNSVMLFGAITQNEIHHNTMRERVIECVKRFSPSQV